MLPQVRTPFGATCQGILQMEATLIDGENLYLPRDLNPGSYVLTTKLQRHMMKGMLSEQSP